MLRLSPTLHYIAGAEQKRLQTLCKQGKLLLWDIRTNDIFLLNKGNVYLLWLYHGSRKLFSNYLEVPQYTSLEVQTWLGVWRWLLLLARSSLASQNMGSTGEYGISWGNQEWTGIFHINHPSLSYLEWLAIYSSFPFSLTERAAAPPELSPFPGYNKTNPKGSLQPPKLEVEWNMFKFMAKIWFPDLKVLSLQILIHHFTLWP